MSDIVMTPDHLRKAAKCVHIAVEQAIADDIAAMLSWAADEIERLRAELAEVVPASYHLRQITELEAEIERLRAALRPFADYADPYGKFPANAVITMGSQISRNQLTMGDCYEARRALSAPK